MSERKEWSRPLSQRITISNENGVDFGAREDRKRVRHLVEVSFPMHGHPLDEFYKCLEFAKCYLVIKDPDSGEYLKSSFGHPKTSFEQNDLEFPFIIHDTALFRETLSKLFFIKNPGEHYEEYVWLSQSGFFQSIFSTATPQDFLYPEQLFRRWIHLLRENPFEGKNEEMNVSGNLKLRVRQKLSSIGQESPYEFCYNFFDADKKDIDFPSVRYGKTGDKELTIFSVQDAEYLGISKTVMNQYETKIVMEEKYKRFFHEIALLKNKYTNDEDEFVRQTLNFDNYKDPYEWALQFFQLKDTKNIEAIKIFYSIFHGVDSSTWYIYTQSRRAKKMYSQRVRDRYKIFSKMDLDSKVVSPHILSFVTTLFYGAKEGLEHVIVPVYYPRREHRTPDDKRSDIDWSIFEQTRKIVFFACENIEGVTLLSEPDIDSNYRLRIEKNKLRCIQYPSIEALIQNLLGKKELPNQ